MIAYSEDVEIATKGKGTHEVTAHVREIVQRSRVHTGIATIFLQHTSASLIIFENADRSARVDLEAYFEHLVPEGSDYFTHTLEGDDDSTSHIKMVLTRTSEIVPVARGALRLGVWQGIFVFEHRRAPHHRRLVVTVLGEG